MEGVLCTLQSGRQEIRLEAVRIFYAIRVNPFLSGNL